MKNTFDQLVKAKHGNCHNQDHVTTRSVAIDIAQVQGAFWILLSGAMLASSFLLTEYFIRLWKDKVKSDQLLLMASRKRLSYDNSDTIPMRRKSPSQFPDLLDFPNSFAKTDEFNGVTHRRAAKI